MVDDRDLPTDPDAIPARSDDRTWDLVVTVAVGGAIGGAARYLVNEVLPPAVGGFPWATFVENVSGGFLLGLTMVLLLDVWRQSRYARPFLAVGVLGGYTTFSAYMADTRALVAAGDASLAGLYVFGSLALGLTATGAGLRLGRSIRDRRP